MKIANRLAGTMAGMFVLFASVTAWAAAGQPEPWQFGLQDAVTPVAEFIHSLHNFLLVIITVITLFVLGLMLYIMLRFNAKANPVPSKNTHNTFLEVAWTVIPILILVAIAIPSLRLLYLQRDIPVADMTVKVIGNPSWNWTYEYPDLGMNDDGSAKVSFTAYLETKGRCGKGQCSLPAGNRRAGCRARQQDRETDYTSDPEGIIHAWTIPSFGMKIDAIPGRLNEDWFKATKEGVYYGQCSELCGKDHAFMPIEVHVVSEADFAAWAEKIKTASIEEARDYLFAMLKAKGQLAQN